MPHRYRPFSDAYLSGDDPIGRQGSTTLAFIEPEEPTSVRSTPPATTGTPDRADEADPATTTTTATAS